MAWNIAHYVFTRTHNRKGYTMRKYTFQDDRTEEQKKTMTSAIVATDKCMSGWGGAEVETSMCAWAFDPNKSSGNDLLCWIEKRREMKRVKFIDPATFKPPSGCAHFHIYAADENHPALRKSASYQKAQ